MPSKATTKRLGYYVGVLALPDYLSGRYALSKNPRALEWNPLQQNDATAIATQIATALACAGLEGKAAKKHPNLAKGIRIGATGLKALAIAVNIRNANRK